MNGDQPAVPEEQWTSWLAAWDDGLAAGGLPESLGPSGLAPELQLELQRDLAYVQRVRRLLQPPHSSTSSPGSPAAPGISTPLPFTSLGRFQIVRELGRGAFGVVLLAHDPLLGRQVALKVPRPEVLVTPELRERFHREARAAAGLDHPNVVPVYEAGEVGPVCFLVSAYCPGITLAQWLKQRSEPVPIPVAAGLLATLAEAVQHAHDRGVVHRDLKPANVLLQKDEGCRMKDESRSGQTATSPFILHPSSFILPKITDFGLAKFWLEGTDGGQTQSGAVVGTPIYMATEQAAGKSRDVGPPADTYALGAMLYELLTGRPPFQGETNLDILHQVRTADPVRPTRLRPRLPRDLETICLKCLHKEPHKRYASAAALGEDLQRFLAGKPIHARPVGTGERLARWCRRNPVLATASGLALAALMAVTAVSTWFAVYQSRAAVRLSQALTDAEKQRGEAERLSATMALDRGSSLCEQGDTSHGMLWLARSLELAPRQDADLQALIRTNLNGWAGQVVRLKAWLEHQDMVQAAAISSDGQTVLTGSEDSTAQLWEVSTGKPHGPRLQHQGPVKAVALSPDGRSVLTGSVDGTARLWEAATGKPIGEPLRHQRTVWAVAFSPDSRTVLTGSEDETAQLWEAATGKPIGPPLKHERTVWSVAVSPDGRTALTGSFDRTARLWETATGKSIGQPLRHAGTVHKAVFSPDGKTILTECTTQPAGSAFLWDATSGKPLGASLPHPGWVMALAFSPDGKTIVTGSSDNLARLWKTATRIPVGPPLPHHGPVNAVAFSPDGQTVLTGSFDGTARLWEASTGKPAGGPLVHQHAVWAVAYGPDGKTIVTASEDRSARLWEVTEPVQGKSLPHQGKTSRFLGGSWVTFSSDGQTAWTLNLHEVRRWETATGRQLGLPIQHPDPLSAVAFHPDGRLTASSGNSARIWDTVTGKTIGAPMLHEGPVLALACSRDGKTILTASEDGTARQWDAGTGQKIGTPLHHQSAVIAVAFSPDGKTLLTGTTNGIAQRWEAASGQPWGTPLEHSRNRVTTLAFSPDGKAFLTKADRDVTLWETTTGKPIGQALRHPNEVTSVAFSPDGKTLLTGSLDGTARLWETATGKAIGAPLRHQDAVHVVAFSPDGKTLLTGSKDRSVRHWEAATRRPLGPPCRHPDEVWAATFSPDGQTILTGCKDNTGRLWTVPLPMVGEPKRVVLWTQVVTGMELDPGGAVRVLDAPTWHERRLALERLRVP